MCAAKLIVLFGPDGAGKSTQADLLTDFLKYYCRVVRTESSIRHLLMVIVYKIFRRTRLRNKRTNYIWLPILPRDKVRLILEMMGVLISIFKISCFRLLGYTVVVEKYIPSTIASLIYIFDGSIPKETLSLLLKFIRNDTYLILLDIDYITHLKRRSEMAEPQDWIECQRNVYRKIALSYNCKVIDTSSLGIEETQNAIRAAIGVSYNKRKHYGNRSGTLRH